jgi:hypothetical protein
MATWSDAALLPHWRDHYLARLVDELCTTESKGLN